LRRSQALIFNPDPFGSYYWASPWPRLSHDDLDGFSDTYHSRLIVAQLEVLNLPGTSPSVANYHRNLFGAGAILCDFFRDRTLFARVW